MTTTDRRAAKLSDADPPTGSASDEHRWLRHPADRARLLVSAAGLAAVLGLTVNDPATAAGISRDVVDLLGWIPATVREGALGLAQLAAVAIPIALMAGLLASAQRRLAVVVAGASLLAALAASGMQQWLDERAPVELLERLATESWLAGAAFPSPAYLAAVAASVTVLGPGLRPPGRRAAWSALGLFAVVRLVTAIVVPLHVVSTVLLGIAAGSAVLVVVGGPARRRHIDDVTAAAAAGGCRLEAITPEGGPWWTGTREDGSSVLVRVIDRDERDADLLYRAFNRFQRRGLGGERPAWSPRRLAEHEAMVTMLAGNAGVKVPTLVGLGAADDHLAALVVTDQGQEVDRAALTDAFLHAAWRQVAALHEARIAHRSLNLDNVRTIDGAPVLVDFADGETSAADELLGIDIAELLVSTGRVVGPDRAVAAAAEVGEDRLRSALGFLQPLALSPETRRALREDGKAAREELLAKLRVKVQAATAADAVDLAPLQRISPARIIGLFGSVVLVYVLLTFVSNRSAIADALADAELSRLPLILALTALVYGAGALSLTGSVSVDLPLSQASEVMLAQSFLNRFTPANAGGMALRARYLQRHGVELVTAATSVGITSVASGVAQVLFLGVFLTWSGTSDGFGFALPDASGIAVLMVVAAMSGAIVWLTPLRARLVDSKLFTSVGRSASELRALAGQPGKLARLLGGAVLGKLLVLLAFVQTCRAFGVDIGFGDLGALYLTANTVASAAPTPGGVGAVEAALVAALTGAGIDGASALSVVLVFRLVTFWLPVPPAYLALRHLRATAAV